MAGPYTGPLPGAIAAGSTYSTVEIHNTSFSGNLSNAGVISGAGTAISLQSGTIAGAIIDTGIVVGTNFGISIDDKSEISGAATAIKIGGPTFSGGISNAGTISVSGGSGISVDVKTGSGHFASIVTFAGGITNSGAISATGNGGGGIFVGGQAFSGAQVTISSFSGGIVNSTDGTINAGGAGIEVGGVAGGAFIIFGELTPGVLQISYFSGGITNAGTISAGGDGMFVGGTAYSGGEVTVSTFSGDLVNSGNISAGGDGIFIGGHADLTSTPPTSAEVFYSYVNIATFDGGITNSGVISAGGDGIAIGAGESIDDGVSEPLPFAGVSSFTGNIVNSASVSGISPGGTITGDIGIFITDVATFTGNIVNGTGASIIAKTGSAIEIGAQGGNLVYYSYYSNTLVNVSTTLPVESFVGSIVNNGTITFSEAGSAYLRAGIQVGTTYGYAVGMMTFSGGITNTGTISVTTTATSGVLDGVFVSGVSQFSGGITNSGLISAHSDRIGTSGSGIVLYYDQTVSGGITNSGDISANFAIGVVDVATFQGNIVNATAGTINAGVNGIDVVGPGFTLDSTFLGSIINQGSITATDGVGIEVDGVAQFGSATAAGNISNSSTITAATGIAVQAATVPGPSHSSIVVDTTMNGSIIDTGDVFATNHGIWIGGGSTISSTATAVFVDAPTFTGGILNAGAIVATQDGILIDPAVRQTFLDGITNTGSIDATNGNGIDVSRITLFGPNTGGGITNNGTITAANGIGVDVSSVATFDGGITNTGTIAGATGIDLTGTPGTTVFDSGVIDAPGGGTAIQLDPSTGTDTVTLATGYAITGGVVGGGSDTLQLGGTGAASFNFDNIGPGQQYTGFTTFEVTGGTWDTTGAGSNWVVEGGTLEVGGSVTNTTVDAGGSLTILTGGSADPTTVQAGGRETIDRGGSDTGVLDLGLLVLYGNASNTTVYAGGKEVVQNGGTLSSTTISGGTMEVVSGGAVTGSIIFGAGTLQIDGPNTPGSNLLPGTTISGFASGDSIDLNSIPNVDVSVNMNDATDELTVTAGADTYTLDFSGDFTGDYFHHVTLGAGTLIIENTTPCYCPGTLIRTPRGEKKIDKLKIGDMVMTASDEARPIKWIGRRSYGGRFVMDRKDILPVCIKAGALEDDVPKRDLWISPNHAMFLNGVLIEAKDLVNGVSIVQMEHAEEVEYFHIELESHDVIIAEGALAESFIDDDSRGLFHNAHEYREKYPDQVIGPAQYCAPRCDSGYELEAVRQRLATRAGLASRDHAVDGSVRGFVDRITPRVIEGWAQNIDHPEAPICLDICAGSRVIGQVLANRYRPDLKRAGIGSGYHSFAFTLPDGLAFASNAVEVRRSLDGAVLPVSEHAKRIGVSAAA